MIDVFIDWSRDAATFDPSAAVARLADDALLGGIAERFTCALPSGRIGPALTGRRPWRFPATTSIEACTLAMVAAADAERPLLIVIGAIEPSAEPLGVLLEALDSDPMIGFAVPRLGNARGDGIARLDVGGDRQIDELPRRILAEIPDTYIVADAPARCLLIKPSVLANFGGLDDRFLTLDAALWHYAGQARRCGFRTLV
ncbi:MAG TPA: hypothetical protein VEL51_18680, partial [Vicinamibacterales bacterium]|nr:hypothetical protein [Vicinamibacterales bacterium]